MIGLLAVVLASPGWAVDLEIDGGSLTLSGAQAFDDVRIVNGGVLYVGGAGSLTITAQTVLVDATSRIDGVGAGAQGIFGGSGGLGGGAAGDGGGGAGHG
nr:hypothetical protein [Deltaproteobacteria bacterium]